MADGFGRGGIHRFSLVQGPAYRACPTAPSVVWYGMSLLRPFLAACIVALSWTNALKAEEDPKEKKRPKAEQKSVEQIAKEATPSLVVVAHEGRGASGTGSGFVVSEDGLIATNLHVIGQARPIKVKFADGKEYDVTEVHASDRKLDLALIRIDPDGRKLIPLPLGD